MPRRLQIGLACAFGLGTHALFVFAVYVMVVSLYLGLQGGHGPFHGWLAAAADCLLLVQFPLVHSFLLTRPGRRLLARAAPAPIGRDVATTTYALAASLQLLLVFEFWSPSGITLYAADGAAYWLMLAAYVASWAFLIKALTDAGLGLQTGFMGWSSVVRGRRPDYGGFPTHGLFRLCRQPVYLGFALVLWTAPIMTLDELALAAVWTAYCLVGPRLKERRYLAVYGDAFAAYRARVPYMLPRLWRGVRP